MFFKLLIQLLKLIFNKLFNTPSITLMRDNSNHQIDILSLHSKSVTNPQSILLQNQLHDPTSLLFQTNIKRLPTKLIIQFIHYSCILSPNFLSLIARTPPKPATLHGWNITSGYMFDGKHQPSRTITDNGTKIGINTRL